MVKEVSLWPYTRAVENCKAPQQFTFDKIFAAVFSSRFSLLGDNRFTYYTTGVDLELLDSYERH